MNLKSLELSGFKSFAKKETLTFDAPITAIVGPNGSGKSNIAEAFRFVLGEQSMKSLRGKRGEDLIWSGTAKAGRSNRASVQVTFDNSNKLFDVDFDEVMLERVVHRDGVNQYFINGSSVRLRDISELLAKANIGASGHHIISQGEADRVLNANLKERRAMIEDALGLRVYHYKLRESERKLDKTKENITHVESLRKEIAPHMRFLKKQVEKVEKSKQLRDDLKERCLDYFKREDVYLNKEKEAIKSERKDPEAELAELENKLVEAKKVLEQDTDGDAKTQEVIDLESELRSVRDKKDSLSRKLGQLEGQLAALDRGRKNKQAVERRERSVPFSEVKQLATSVKEQIAEGEAADNLTSVKGVVRKIGETFSAFMEKAEASFAQRALPEMDDEQSWQELTEEKKSLDAEYDDLKGREIELVSAYTALRKKIESAKDESREAERTVFTLMTRQTELRGVLGELSVREARFVKEKEVFEEDLRETAVLAGHEVLSFAKHDVAEELLLEKERGEQEKRRKEIEKIKIRLEEFGGGGGEEVLKEYKDIEERDQFLSREIEDLERSAETLKKLIDELEEKLDTQFKQGIEKINKAFQTFFELMFDGGSASLLVLREQKKRRRKDTDIEDMTAEEEMEGEEEEGDEGIDISVTLPRKRIKGLEMLSGGERALTSIALLFAMSQVNPPPFLILDETDAALDEANSRRYSSMIKDLSKHSQLILITHNRETMSAAQILYGVTMGGDGMSKLLSVQFEEAVAVAK